MANEWTRVAELADVDEDGTLAADVDGHAVCLYNIAGEILATDAKCTHGDADLADGLVLDSALIECPLHEGTFDIRTGKAVGAPCTQALRCHAVRIQNGVIYLRPVEAKVEAP